MADLAEGLFGDFELAAGEGSRSSTQRVLDGSRGAGGRGLREAARRARRHRRPRPRGVRGEPDVAPPRVGEVRPYPGSHAALERLREPPRRELPLGAGAAQPPGSADVPYAAADPRRRARRARVRQDQLAIELNASQENPRSSAAEGRILPVGNFDVLPLAAALDFLRVALAPALTSACERALKLLQAPLTGLPDGLAAPAGPRGERARELGVAAQGVVGGGAPPRAAGLLRAGTSTHAEGIEDRIDDGAAGRPPARRDGGLGERLAAIGFTVAAQAIDLRRPRRSAPGRSARYGLVRERIPFMDVGRSAARRPRARRRARPLGRPALVSTRYSRRGEPSRAPRPGHRLGAEGYLFELERRGYLKAGPSCRRSCSTSRRRSASSTASSCARARTSWWRSPTTRTARSCGDRPRGRPRAAEPRRAAHRARGRGRGRRALRREHLQHLGLRPGGPRALGCRGPARCSTEQVAWAAEEGADLVIAETYDYLGEALMAIEAIKAAGLPSVVTFASTRTDDRRLRRPTTRAAARAGRRRRRRPQLLSRPDDDAADPRAIRAAVGCHVAAQPVPYRTTAEQPTFQSAEGRGRRRGFPIALEPFTCTRFEMADFAGPPRPRHRVHRHLLRRRAAPCARDGRGARSDAAGEPVLTGHLVASVLGEDPKDKEKAYTAWRE